MMKRNVTKNKMLAPPPSSTHVGTTCPCAASLSGGTSKGPLGTGLRMNKYTMPKAFARMRPKSIDNCKSNELTTWDGMLSARSKSKSESVTSGLTSPINKYEDCDLNLFDPFRTMKFLLRELESKLRDVAPGNKNFHKIFLELYQTTKRLKMNAAAASPMAIQPPQQVNRVKKYNSSCQTEKTPILCYEKPVQTDSSTCQMIECASMTEGTEIMMGDQLKNSQRKLEENCSALNAACLNLRNENSGVHGELTQCRNEILSLKNEICTLQKQLKYTAGKERNISQELEERCKVLQNELKSLQNIVKKQTDEMTTAEDLSKNLLRSSEKINVLETTRLENDKMLVFTKFEKEKLLILEKFHEKQIKILQNEITNMCQLVKDQLEDIQSASSSSDGNLQKIDTIFAKADKEANQEPFIMKKGRKPEQSVQLKPKSLPVSPTKCQASSKQSIEPNELENFLDINCKLNFRNLKDDHKDLLSLLYKCPNNIETSPIPRKTQCTVAKSSPNQCCRSNSVQRKQCDESTLNSPYQQHFPSLSANSTKKNSRCCDQRKAGGSEHVPATPRRSYKLPFEDLSFDLSSSN